MPFIEEYKGETLKILNRIFPDLPKEELEEFISEEISKNLVDPECTFWNNYTNKTAKTSLLKFITWVDKKKPILTEHGVCFKPNALNPNADMLADITNSRKVFKKQMFDCQRDGDMEGAKLFDIKQKVMKRFSNSYYGVSGQKRSIFYNLHVALSVTGKGQSIATTSLTSFEGFLANNILFNSLDDCLIFMQNIILEKPDRRYKDKEVLDGNISKETLVDYLLNQFFDKKNAKNYRWVIEKFVEKLNKTNINRIYYKNNLLEFCKNETIVDLINRILSIESEFRDPNNIPEEMKEDIEEFWAYIDEYVFYNYPIFDRMTIAKEMRRKRVIGCDTDSNFINLEPWYEFILSLEGIDDENKKDVFKIINLITVVLNNVISNVFLKITELSNVPEGRRKQISMKNEFLLKRILLTENKKNYASVIVLQEGIEKDPPKLDIKGLTIRKSNVNKNTRDILKDILEEDVLKSENINLKEVLRKLEGFEDRIRESFEAGETTFMKPDKVNEISSYKMPYSIPALRGILVWNLLYPDVPIPFPAQVNTVKLTSASIDRLAYLYENKKTKKFYKILKENVFEDENLKNYGFSIIAIPKEVDKIPDWIIPVIDIDTVVRDNLSNFIIILNSIGVKTISLKADELFFSNIIDF